MRHWRGLAVALGARRHPALRRLPLILLFLLCGGWPLNAACDALEAWKGSMYLPKPDADRAVTVREALRTFARAFNLELKAESGWRGDARLSPDNQARAPDAFLNRLALIHRFEWFVAGSTLHIAAPGAWVSERVEIGAAERVVKAALEQSGSLQEKFGWSADAADARFVFVSGPGAYVEQVRQELGRLFPPKPPSTDEETEVMMFRLQHATAGDGEMRARGAANATVVPGVATMLSELVDRRSRSTAPRGAGSKSDDGASAGAGAGIRMRLDEVLASVRSQALDGGGADGLPLIKAYPPLNAVMVKDKPSRRAVYERLIAQLDVPVRQLEILIEIVDVDQSRVKEWSAGVSYGRSSIGTVGSAAASLSNVVLWSADRLALTLRALESDGAAKVVLRPSIVALDNGTAVIDVSQSAYVPLVGERIADLKEITVGTSLRVTPRLLSAAQDSAILVSVQLEDGSLSAAVEASAPPMANRGAISTQAIVREGEALVIGGRRQQTRTSARSRIPGLASLPWIGKLFQSDSERDQTQERVFVIRARVLDGAPSDAAAADAATQAHPTAAEHASP